MKMFDNVSLRYGDKIVFDELSLTIKPASISCIVGASGGGKTSLLNMLAGTLSPQSGRIIAPFDRVAYVFQEDRLLEWRTVYQNISLVGRGEVDADRILQLLDALNIGAEAEAYPRQLSGGMRQRVALARAFYYQPQLLLMDEPFQSLDYLMTEQLIVYTQNLWRRHKMTLIFVTHDIDEAILMGQYIYVLAGKPSDVTAVFDMTELKSENPADYLAVKAEIIRALKNNGGIQ